MTRRMRLDRTNWPRPTTGELIRKISASWASFLVRRDFVRESRRRPCRHVAANERVGSQSFSVAHRCTSMNAVISPWCSVKARK